MRQQPIRQNSNTKAKIPQVDAEGTFETSSGQK